MSPGISQPADGAKSGEYALQIEVFMYLFQLLKNMGHLSPPHLHLSEQKNARFLSLSFRLHVVVHVRTQAERHLRA